MKIYDCIINNVKTKGSFFTDNNFGSFFFTDKIDNELDFMEYSSFILKNDCVIINSSQEGYRIYKLNRNNKYIYAVAILNKEEFDASYLTLDDLSIQSSFSLFTGGDILEYLAGICELPTGNFIVGNVQDYISSIEKILNKYNDKEAFFRGHYYYKYELVPSLYRKKKYYENESFMYMDFKTQFYRELSNKKYIEILTTMQHYRMPTRLLDTTSNPLVALYMACDKPYNFKSKNYGIGEVVLMTEDRRNIKYSDSNVVTLLSCLAVLETNYKQELYEKITESLAKNDPSIYQNCMAYKRFKAEVQTELPYFDDSFFTPEVLLHPRHVKVGMINDRIIAQSGSFILFGLCNYLTGDYCPLTTVTKERIFVVHRDYITKQLELLNINTGTMYPDKDHMSSIITRSYE